MAKKRLFNQILILAGLIMIWTQIIAIAVFAILFIKKIYSPFDLLNFTKFLPLSWFGSLLLFGASWQIFKIKNNLKVIISSLLIATIILILGQILCQSTLQAGEIRLVSSCLIIYLSALFSLGISSLLLFRKIFKA